MVNNKIVEVIPFEVGNMCFITRGANCGRIGTVVHKERHPGSHDIVHIKDRRGNTFATRSSNVFVIGHGEQTLISLPKDKGLKSTIFDERAARQKRQEKKEARRK